MTAAPAPFGHITVKAVDDDRVTANCSVCGQGIDVGAMFGPIQGADLIATWAKQHAHTPRKARKR